MFISQEVIRELSDVSFRHKDDALSLVAAIPLLVIDQEVAGVAEVLVKEHLMPAPAVGDAVHVAVYRNVGLVPPRIVTPDFLWEDE